MFEGELRLLVGPLLRIGLLRQWDQSILLPPMPIELIQNENATP
jgi:hypothetical protein